MADLKKRILTLAERQRLIESVSLISGVCGAFYGVIMHKSILGGVIWALANSIFGGLVATLLVYFIGRTRLVTYRRNKLEREVSMFISAMGSLLIGAVIGGTMGIMMNLRHFSMIYGSQIDASFIKIVDGTLMGGIGGLIGALVGTFISESNTLIIEWFNHHFLKKLLKSNLALQTETDEGETSGS